MGAAVSVCIASGETQGVHVNQLYLLYYNIVLIVAVLCELGSQ